MKTIAAFALALALLFAPAALSIADAPAPKPSKESLLAAWEQVQKDDVNTVKLEKTEEQGVYDFETTIFPYKGKGRVVNLLIEKNPPYIYEFRDYDDERPEGDYVGIVELELDGVDEKFTRKFSHSYQTWARNNSLYYHAETKKWYTPEQWAAYKKELRAAKKIKDKLTQGDSCPPAKNQEKDKPTLFGILLSWFPMLLLIGVWIFFMRSACASKQKQVIEKSLPHMDRTEEHMAKTEKLLEEILKSLKEKK